MLPAPVHHLFFCPFFVLLFLFLTQPPCFFVFDVALSVGLKNKTKTKKETKVFIIVIYKKISKKSPTTTATCHRRLRRSSYDGAAVCLDEEQHPPPPLATVPLYCAPLAACRIWPMPRSRTAEPLLQRGFLLSLRSSPSLPSRRQRWRVHYSRITPLWAMVLTLRQG